MVIFYFESGVTEVAGRRVEGSQPTNNKHPRRAAASIRVSSLPGRSLLGGGCSGTDSPREAPRTLLRSRERATLPDARVIHAPRPLNMTSYKAFHSQLTAIMEALTKAAVAEICELVDDSYAVLQLEITRSHKENEALRRKLELIETIIARGYRGSAAVLDYGGAQEETGGRLVDFTVGESRGPVSPRYASVVSEIHALVVWVPMNGPNSSWKPAQKKFVSVSIIDQLFVSFNNSA